MLPATDSVSPHPNLTVMESPPSSNPRSEQETQPVPHFVDQLPEEIMATITSFLPIGAMSSCLAVCTKWRAAVLKHLHICFPFSQDGKNNVIPFANKEFLHLESFREFNSFWLRVNESIFMDLGCKGKPTFIGGSLHNLLEKLIESVDESEMNDRDEFELSSIAVAVIAGVSGSLEFMTSQQRNQVLSGNLPQSMANSPSPPGPLLGSPISTGASITFPNLTSGESVETVDEEKSASALTEAPHSFQRSFLKTFESFLSKSNLCRMCFLYLIDLDKEQMVTKQPETQRKVVKLMKVLNMFIHYCIRMDPKDEENDDMIVLQFSQFLDLYLIHGGANEYSENPLNTVKYLKGIQIKHNLYKKLITLEEQKKKRQFKIINRISSSSSTTRSDIARETNIYTIGLSDLAKQLTILQFEHYKNLRPFEFIGFPWRKCANKCPSIVMNNKHFENVAKWVASEIVVPKDVHDRAKAFKFFIDLCFELFNYQNFETIFAISAGIMSASAFRLKLTRQEAGDEYEEKLEHLREIVSLRANFRMLRSLLESVKSEACIPYLGLFLSDLKNLHDTSNQLRKYIEKEKELSENGVTCVNWFTVLREYQIIHQLMFWKQKCEEKYQSLFEKDETIQIRIDQYLKQASSFEELYQISLKREPRQNN